MESWNRRLNAAAFNGDVKDLKLCIENGANPEYRGYKGGTALMSAARQGHLDITHFLITNGCKKDASDTHGRKALHLAAYHGHLNVVRYLVEHVGISPLIKTNKGETPYDSAAISEAQGLRGIESFNRLIHPEGGPVDKVTVMPPRDVKEYLQTIMSKQDEDVQGSSTPTEDTLPDEIKLMSDKKSIPMYLKLLESGSEKKRDIRLVIVGKKGSGKTSLVKRLFEEDTGEVTSTNGIDIHRIRCRANTDDGIWNKLEGINDETDTNARLFKPYVETLKNRNKKSIGTPVQEAIHVAPPVFTEPKVTTPGAMKPKVTTPGATKPNVTTPGDTKPKVTTPGGAKPKVTTPVYSYNELQLNVLSDQFKRDTKNVMKSKVDLYDKEEYATLLLWDFAGDEEFYHTHQTFLSPDSIYLVVAKLNEAEDKQAKDLFRLWMDSIHCYSRLEGDISSTDDMETTCDVLDPPVVIVGTWKDALTSESDEIQDVCRKNILMYTKHMAEDERGHVRDAVFISNTTDDNSVYQPIRQYILKLARQMRTWNIKYPLKFIQLEKSLHEKKKELPIIPFKKLEHIAENTPMPLNGEELILYLKYHHEIRALVYFEDLPDHIILDTQWLSNAFKCIVTAKPFRNESIQNQKRWEEFHSRGKLHSVVLEDILKEKQNILFKHNKDHILKLMEKFDIIICPDKSDKQVCYYVPCMIKAEPECGIYKMFNVTGNTCQKSTWLCFKFKFLPPHLMNHLIASLSRLKDVAEVRVTEKNQTERVFALFKGIAVFELDKKTKLSKLLVTTIPNSIQIQILEFGKSAVFKKGIYGYLNDFVTAEINKIISRRFRMTNVHFTKKWECGLTNLDDVTGSNEFSEDQHTEYYCETCIRTHEFTNEWVDHPYKASSDCYDRGKGLVLIVNFMFSGTRERKGSEVDVMNLIAFFKDELRYKVVIPPQSDMTKMELQDCLHNIASEHLVSEDYKSFICVIMSHGNKDGLVTIDNSITAIEITEPFKNKSGGKFNGKPKLFLIQACRGRDLQEKVDYSDTQSEMNKSCDEQSRNLESEDTVHTDAIEHVEDSLNTDASEDISRIPEAADIILAHATTPGCASIRHPTLGSYFIRSFLAVAKKQYKKKNVEDMLLEVRREVAENKEYEPKLPALAGKCQMVIVESTSRKEFYLESQKLL